jgi:penicillin amidase
MADSRAARLTRYVNFAILAVVLAALGVAYRLAWRPLPTMSGSIDAPLSANASVTFDRLGVPHIRAATFEDALFVQGYCTAQERMFQMDLLRRFNAGELSEVFGPQALDADRESRRLRLRRVAEAAYITMPAADRAAIAAYARGVNEYLATHRSNLPVEFTLARYAPRPWSAIDTLLICLHMFRSLTSTFHDELLKRSMLAAGDPALVRELFPVRSGAEVQPGSNAWVVSGSRTATGRPLLSNDPHLEYSLPGIWYMTHLTAPGLDVDGVALPGAPGVMIGHNRRIAWGITNLHFDVQDLYIEKIDERTGRYIYQGKIEQARGEREVIRVKGQSPVEVTTWVTRHGPVIAGEGSEHLALRWTASEPGILQYPILEINRAENWEQFSAALARFPGPGSNFVYADVDGNIGYHAAGVLPKRNGYLGDVPVDGSTGEFEWDGYIPFNRLPSAYNPPSGLIVTANQNPFPADYPYAVNGNFASPQRLLQVRNLLEARKGWRAEEMITVQKDVYSSFDHFLARQLVAAYEKRNAHEARLDAVVTILKGWNGQMEKNLAAPFVTTLAYQHLRTALVERAAPGKGREYDFQMARAVVERILRERPARWFQDYDELLLRVLADAVEEGRRIQGADIANWQWGRSLRVRIDNPVMHQVPLVGGYFDIGPVPMSGSSSSPKQTTTRLAPSMRMTADLGDWERSWMNITTGQSGHPLSPHYRDQWNDYYWARSYPMRFENIEAKSTLTFRAR